MRSPMPMPKSVKALKREEGMWEKLGGRTGLGFLISDFSPRLFRTPSFEPSKFRRRLRPWKAGAPETNQFFGFGCTGLPSFTAQPPLALQEFLPWQPLSPPAQPPLPLQE